MLAFEGTPKEHQERARARQALRERFMPRLYQVKLRLLEVETEIAAATSWGAGLGALDEERKNLEMELMLLTVEENR